MERTTSAPSPTAAATRLVEPLRTSPMAKTPRRVHSSISGPRSAPSQCREKSAWRPRLLAGDHEALVVLADVVDQPLRPRRGADHREHRGGLDAAIGPRTRDHDGFELLVTLERPHLAPGPDADVRLGLDLIDQVARHRHLEPSPGDDVDLARVVGELDHRLAGRVSSADDDDILRRALLGLDVGRRVVQAQPLESICVLGRQSAIVRARGQDHATGRARADRRLARPRAVLRPLARTPETPRGRWRSRRRTCAPGVSPVG